LKRIDPNGGDRDRTDYLLHAMQSLYHLSYTPDKIRYYTFKAVVSTNGGGEESGIGQRKGKALDLRLLDLIAGGTVDEEELGLVGERALLCHDYVEYNRYYCI
jgi:hypothetical protein